MLIKFNQCNLKVDVNINRTNDLSKISAYIKKALYKKYKENEIVENLKSEFIIDKCKICGTYLNFKLVINSDFNIIQINQYKGTNNDNLYCFGKNPNCLGKKMNSNSAEFVSIMKNISIPEALKYIKSHNKSPFYKENFKTSEEHKKFQRRDLFYFTNKYGTDEGTKKYNNSLKKQNYSRSIDGYIERYGSIEGRERWIKCQKSKDSMSRSCFNSENGYINRINSVKSGKQDLIKKYGYNVGLEKFKNREKRRFETMFNNGTLTNFYSKWSIKLIEQILLTKEYLELNPISCNYATYNKEIGLYDKENKKYYFYDFVFETSTNKIIIEFNGTTFHASPELTNEQRVNWKHPFSNETFLENYTNYEIKKQLAINAGYLYFIVWDDKTDEFNLEQIKQFLKKI